MPRRSWMLALLSIPAGLVLIGGVLMAVQQPPRRIPLSPGRSLEVRRVTVGTHHALALEPAWKEPLRRFLPASLQSFLGPFIGYRFNTERSELVVWFDQFKPAGRASAPFEAILEDGAVVPGRIRGTQNYWQPTCVEFSSFARSSRQIRLRVHEGASIIEFAVANPHPTRAVQWISRPFPQTNQMPGTTIVLRSLRPLIHGSHSDTHFRPAFEVEDPSGAPVGWISWRTTAFDPWGNWSQNNGSSLVIALPSRGHPLRLATEAREYLSAGRIPLLTNGAAVLMTVTPRMQRFGLQRVIFADRGSHQIDESGAIVSRPLAANPVPGALPTLLGTMGSGSAGSLQLTTPGPVVVCVFDQAMPAENVAARVRERLSGIKEGRIFPTAGMVLPDLPNAGLRQRAALFIPTLPAQTTNLEVEIVVTHPTTDFLVPSPLVK